MYSAPVNIRAFVFKHGFFIATQSGPACPESFAWLSRWVGGKAEHMEKCSKLIRKVLKPRMLKADGGYGTREVQVSEHIAGPKNRSTLGDNVELRYTILAT